MGQFIIVPGIITAASKASIKATKIVIKCKNCKHEKTLNCHYGFGGVAIPRFCDNAKNPGLDK